MRVIGLMCVILLLGGCMEPGKRPFQLKNLAKSDIDMVADAHIRETQRLARLLAIKLYKRNPRELKKVPGMTLDRRLDQLFPPTRLVRGFDELGYKDGYEAAPLAFSENFEGDRVFALMAGVTGMLHRAYNGQKEVFLLDELDHQKLYNSARNLESIAWHLNNRHRPDGQLYLLSNGISDDGVTNYSYERILSKLISLQDMMANIIADSTNRTITRVVHSAASMTLLPI
ncbi:hypothetical protein [Neptuniibacter sp. CAU 1671]|uniref:hypothetical protein n=1 Tax=Neptuniibacter sp. CAU 1671 TaxID=3032593 RepID=UPI0023D9FC77|nr:hypothetical protein [Neptuniibacter sp. CAU 1671]MDF2181857.1 hypothetical protein [Neptuniibacter sp. CAU 1671]